MVNFQEKSSTAFLQTCMKMSSTNPAPSTVRYLETTEAYDLWSTVYDTDGNFLQALDTIGMKTLLPKMLYEMRQEKPWQIIDLGCGTGRNTTALLTLPETKVFALDASPKMLEVARSRLEETAVQLDSPATFELGVVDLLKSNAIPESALNSDAIVSTLVIEHIPVRPFFEAVSQALKPGGILLLTNMHSEMGGISQAGFVDPNSGTKIRPTSYAHTVEEVVKEASRQGLEVLGSIDEKAVDENLAEILGPRSKKWIGVTVWFGGMFRKIGTTRA